MAEFNLVDQTNLFKINYYKKSENMFNSANVLAGRIKKRYDFTGKQRFVSTPLSFSGGVGSGILPTSNSGRYEGAVITSKRVYATCQIERESIKASANNAGAFVQATKETVKKTVESFMRNNSRILFGDGSGILGSGDAATNVTGLGTIASPYLMTMDATFNEANFEEKDYVNMVVAGAVETTLLEIVSVNVALKQIGLVGTSARLAALTGVGPAIATDQLAMQNSYNNDPQGLKGVLDATTGSLYGIPVQRRWQAHQVNAAGAGITVDLMNQVMLDVEKKFGKAPNMIMVSYEQFRNILALMEDHKRYPLPNRNIKENLSFQGIEFMSTRGPIGIFTDRFCPKDRIYFLNDNYIECHMRPDFGWFDDDGTVFLRKDKLDSYEARYGGYFENFITPTAHGVLSGLAV